MEGPLTIIDYDDLEGGAGPSSMSQTNDLTNDNDAASIGTAPLDDFQFSFSPDLALEDVDNVKENFMARHGTNRMNLVEQPGTEKLSTTPASTSAPSMSAASHLSTNFYKMLQSVERELKKEHPHAAITTTTDKASKDRMVTKCPGHQMWVEKYKPTKFTDLLTVDRVPVEVLQWATKWKQSIDGGNSDRGVIKSGDGSYNKKRRTNWHTHGRSSNSITTRGNSEANALSNTDESKILLLAGSPGLGKTTLAHIVAKTAGFDVIEINASDERSGEGVVAKVMAAISNNSMKSPGKPNLVIIDEIDGALGSGSGGGSNHAIGSDKNLINLLVKLATTKTSIPKKGSTRNGDHATEGADFTDSDEDSGKSTATAAAGKPTQKRSLNAAGTASQSSLILKRPIICICNDLYSPALKPLKSVCQVLTMRRANGATLTHRLRQICEAEGLRVDGRALMDLVDLMDGDMRCCLHALQFLSKSPSKKPFTSAHLSEMLAGAGFFMKDTTKSAFSIYEAIFSSSPRQTSSKGVPASKSTHDSSTLMKILSPYSSGVDLDRILMGTFELFPKCKFYDDAAMSKVNEGLEWFSFIDQCQSFSLDDRFLSYQPHALTKIHRLFSSPTTTISQLGLPKQDYMNHLRIKKNKSIIDEYSPTMISQGKEGLMMERIPALLKIIQANSKFRLPNPQLLRVEERIKLTELAQLMLREGLSYRQVKRSAMAATALFAMTAGEGLTYDFVLDPPIHRLVSFTDNNSIDDRDEMDLEPTISAVENATRQMVAGEIELQRIIGKKGSHITDPNVAATTAATTISKSKEYRDAYSTTATGIIKDEAQSKKPIVKRDFFGRTIMRASGSVATSSTTAAMPCASAGVATVTPPLRTIIYHFNEGFTNAIRRSIKIKNVINLSNSDGVNKG